MSAASNIVVFDGASTPVSHTLVPISVEKENGKLRVTYREKIATLPEEAQIYAFLTTEKTKAGTTVSTLDVRVPVMESVSGVNASGYTAAPRVAYEDRNVWTNYAHPRSTVSSRRLARMLLVNVANGIATSVAPVATGPWPEQVDQLISPI